MIDFPLATSSEVFYSRTSAMNAQPDGSGAIRASYDGGKQTLSASPSPVSIALRQELPLHMQFSLQSLCSPVRPLSMLMRNGVVTNTSLPHHPHRARKVSLPGKKSATAQEARTPTPPRTTTHRVLSEKETFMLFLSILWKILEESGDTMLLARTKALVADFSYRHQLGDPTVVTLHECVERRLRSAVGELYWTRFRQAFEDHCTRNGLIVWNPDLALQPSL